MTMLHAEVVGYLWSGEKAAYQYSCVRVGDHEWSRKDGREIRDDVLKGRSGSIQAVDFREVIDVRLVQEVNTYERAGSLSRRTDTFKTLAGWRSGSSRRFYAKMTYGR